MGQTWALIITPIGAVTAALVGVIVGGLLTRRAQRQERSQQEQSDACDEFDDASAKILVDLAVLSGHHMKSDMRSEKPDVIDWREWNAALAKVNKHAAKEIVTRAHVLDEQIWHSHNTVRAGLASWEEWFVLREKIEHRRLEFVNAVRHVAGLEPLERLSGRPSSNDQVWSLGQSGVIEASGQRSSGLTK